MTVGEIQRIIDEYDYWDLAVKKLECNYFADEIVIMYDDTKDNYVYYNFIGCYKSTFDHVKEYDKIKPVKDMTQGQIPYFLQDVKISETTEKGVHFFVCEINMFPLYLEIWCKDIHITKQYKDV